MKNPKVKNILIAVLTVTASFLGYQLVQNPPVNNITPVKSVMVDSVSVVDTSVSDIEK